MRHRFISLLAHYPRTALLLWLLVSAAATTGCLWLRFDFSPESVYSGQDEAVDFSNRHKRMFRFEDSVCLVILQSTDSRSVIRADCLDWIREFGNQVQTIAGVQQVSSLLTLRKPRVNLDAVLRRQSDNSTDAVLNWSPLISFADLADDEVLQDRLDRLPLLNDLLISSDRTLLLTAVALDPEFRGVAKITPPVTAIEQLLASLPYPENTRSHLSGVPPIRVDIIRALQADQYVMVPICATLFLIISVVMFRSMLVTAISLMSVLMAVGTAVGLMGWMGQPFNLLSNVVPPLALIIAAANSVHIVKRFQSLLFESSEPTLKITIQVMSEMSVTCFLTLATTAIGFGSLLLARSVLLQSLATQAVLAMFCCYVSLIVVMTSGLALCGDRLSRSKFGRKYDGTLEAERQSSNDASERITNIHESSILHRLATRFTDLITRQARLVAFIHIGFAALALAWVSDMRVNSLMFETYDPQNPVMQTIQLLDKKLSGIVSLEVQLRGNQASDFFRPDVIAGLQQIRRKAESDSRITFYRDYSQILAAFDSRLLSGNSSTADSALRRIHRVTQKVDVSEVTRDFLSSKEPVARVMMRVHDIGSAGLKTLITDVEHWMQQDLPQDIGYTVTGDAALHAICMDVFVRDLFVSLIAASGVIFALIAVLFRSLRTGLIATVPNLFPLIITIGWMKVRGFELNAGNVIVFAIGLGIAVDDTIHFLARYRLEMLRHSDQLAAVRATMQSCGQAIILTTILIVCGISVLAFSDFVPTRRFAELTAVTMLAALPGDLVLLPCLLVLFKRSGRFQRATEP